MKVYKSVWHADFWEANNCKQEDINSFFEVFNKLAQELLDVERDKPSSDGVNIAILQTKCKFLVRTQVDRVPLLRLLYLGLSEVFAPCRAREEIYSKIINAMPLVITPQNIDYIFLPDISSQ